MINEQGNYHPLFNKNLLKIKISETDHSFPNEFYVKFAEEIKNRPLGEEPVRLLTVKPKLSWRNK